MKHFRKVCAVLLAVLMVAVMLPSLGLFSVDIGAAEVGMIENGNFSQSETLNHSTGSGTWVHALYWEQYEWGASVSNGAVDFSKDSTTANHITLSQVVAVNTNAQYRLTFKVKGGKLNCESTPCFTYKVLGGTKGDTCNVQLAAGTPTTGSSYQTNTVTINTGNYKYIDIQFISTGTGTENSQLDDVSLTVVNAGDTGTHAKPSFVDFGNELNRPKDSASNVVKQPSFEATTDAQWNDPNFIKTYLSTASDPDAKDGSKVLLYNNPGTIESWHYFELNLPSGGNYVLSAWVKSPFLSATNQGTASIGIIDPDTNKFFMSGLADYKGHASTPYLQIRPTATDNEWHLRSVTFFVGSAGTVKIGVYGKQSKLYIDDISVHLATNGVTYVGDQTGTLTATNNTSNMYCESEDNLIPDCNMTGTNAEKFWTTNASGWNNGFMNFNKDDSRLEFNSTGASGKKIYHYIKWIPVEPDTKYTVSFDYRVTAKGSGQLRFLDNNIDLPVAFKTYSFSSTTNDWTTTSFTFNSGNYNRIAVAFTDGGGTAYFDDFRIFKSTDGIANEPEEEVFPTLKHNHEGKSRMEMTSDKLGLAFRFDLDCTGASRDETSPTLEAGLYEANYANAKVQPFEDGVNYKLIAAGAVMTNNAMIGQDPEAFVLENTSSVAGSNIIDIPAKYLWMTPVDSIDYIVRIVNIPLSHMTTVIYARPYYIFEYQGRQVTAYGDIEFDSYKPMTDINDGWLEWD